MDNQKNTDNNVEATKTEVTNRMLLEKLTDLEKRLIQIEAKILKPLIN